MIVCPAKMYFHYITPALIFNRLDFLIFTESQYLCKRQQHIFYKKWAGLQRAAHFYRTGFQKTARTPCQKNGLGSFKTTENTYEYDFGIHISMYFHISHQTIRNGCYLVLNDIHRLLYKLCITFYVS